MLVCAHMALEIIKDKIKQGRAVILRVVHIRALWQRRYYRVGHTHSRAILQRQIIPKHVKTFPAFDDTREFIAMFTKPAGPYPEPCPQQ